MRNTLHPTTLLKAFLAFFLASVAFCADPPDGSLRLKIDFLKSTGYENYLDSEDMAETSAQEINNVDFGINGNLNTAFGVRDLEFDLTSYDISPSEIQTHALIQNNRWFSFFKSTNTAYYYITIARDTLAHSQQLVYQSQIRRMAGKQGDGVNWDGVFYFVSESSPGIKLSEPGTPNSPLIVSTITAMPSGKFARIHLDSLFVSGNSTTPYRVYYSSEGLPESFTSSSYFDISPSAHPDEITGIGESLLGQLPIYTRTTTRALIGNSLPDAQTGSGGNVIVRMISDDIGCIHGRTVKNLNNKQYFFSLGAGGSLPGIYVYNGISVKEKTKAVRNFFEKIVSKSTGIIPSAFVYRNEYCLSVSTVGGFQKDCLVCINDESGATTIRRPWRIGEVSVREGEYYFISSQLDFYLQTGNRMIKKLSNNYEDHYTTSPYTATSPMYVPYNWRYKTKDFAFPPYENREKNLSFAVIKYQNANTTFTVTANYDFGKSSTTWNIWSTNNYRQGNNLNSAIQTINYTSETITSKILFPTTTPNVNKFFNINFDFSGSSFTKLNSMEAYGTALPYK